MYLSIRAGQEEEYDRRHQAVWPELLHDLIAAGMQQYSIFRRGRMLFLYLQVNDFNFFLQQMAASAVNAKWQAMMADVLEPVAGLQPEEQFAIMQEVFYLSAD